MSSRCRFPAILFSLAVLAAASSCSNTPPAAESGNPGAEAAPDSASPQSNADQVGSVPEDMLADEKGVEGAAAKEEGLPASTEVADKSSDPFGDLAEKKDEPKKAESKSDMETLIGESDSGSGGSSAGESHASAGSGKMERYTVKAGDTLMKIAFNLYGDVDRWKDLHELNHEALKNGSALRKGMKLRYEAPLESFSPDQLSHSYQIKKGDTLAGIADDLYGKKMKYKKLQAYNKRLIKNPNRIFAGFTIYYDITEQEMAEAEARRAQKAAGGGGTPKLPPAPPASPAPPSALQPPAPPANKNVANDTSTAPVGPPTPTQQ